MCNVFTPDMCKFSGVVKPGSRVQTPWLPAKYSCSVLPMQSCFCAVCKHQSTNEHPSAGSETESSTVAAED